jgi:hypothetical protein
MFQFRVVANRRSYARRLCEERIFIIDAGSAPESLAKAKRRGRKAEHRYRNTYDHMVHYEFIGVMAIVELGLECDDDEVWYEFYDRVRPDKRRSRFIPSQDRVFRNC